MDAVCALDHFQERIAARPQNRATLMAMDPKAFIAAMERWREQFAKGAELPIIGASEKRSELDQGPGLHHPRQRQDPQSCRGRDRAPHDPAAASCMISFPATSTSTSSRPRTGLQGARDGAESSPIFSRARRPRRPEATHFHARLETVGGSRMKRSTQRMLTTHTGSLPRPATVVELLLDEQKQPGSRSAPSSRPRCAARSPSVVREAGRLPARRHQRRRAGPHRLHRARQGSPHRLRRPERAAARHRRAGISRARRRCWPVRLAVPASAGLLGPGRLEGFPARRGRHRARQGGDGGRHGARSSS